jgi:hypothetical protein
LTRFRLSLRPNASTRPLFISGGLAELHGVGALLNSLRLFLLHEVEERLDFVERIVGNDLRAQDKREPLPVFHHPVREAGGILSTPFYT